MDDSWKFDRHRFDADKEISQVFSTALDDISQITDDENDDYSTDDEMFVKKLESKQRTSKYDMNGNHFLSSSTPMHPRALKAQNRYAESDQKTPSKRYSNHDHDESFTDARSRISPKMNGFTSHKQKENIECKGNLKHENDLLSKNISNLNDKCTIISTNYEELQSKFHELYKVNEHNLEVIDKLQAKVRSLENRVKDEAYLKESAMKKAEILESSVNSLENQLQEYSRTDFYSKTTESHQKVIESLKQKYDRELNSIRKEVDLLREKLHEKDEELALQTSIHQKTSSEQIKRVIDQTRKTVSKEIQDKMEREYKKNSKDLMQNFDRKIVELKDDWQIKLLEDVNKIILWLDESVNEDDMEPKSTPNNELHFTALQQLCDYLNSYLKEHENRIQIQVSEFRKTKKLLEDALIQSQMASCNVTETNVLAELELIKEENVRISQKLNKYKECYKALVKKHEHEIESLKDDFKQIIANKSRPTG